MPRKQSFALVGWYYRTRDANLSGLLPREPSKNGRRNVGEIVASRREHLQVLLQQTEQAQPRVVHVMAGERTRRKFRR